MLSLFSKKTSTQNPNLSSFFLNILGKHKLMLCLMYQAPIIGAFFIPVNNYAIKLLVDHLTSNPEFTFSQILTPIILYALASIILEVVWRISNFADYKCQPLIEAKIVDKAYEKLLDFRYQFFLDQLSGKLASKINDLRNCYVYVNDNLRFNLIYQIISILVCLYLLFITNNWLAILVSLWLAIFVPAVIFINIRGAKYSQKATAEKQKISGLINDGISNISNILFFSARKFELQNLRRANCDFIVEEKKRLRFIFINHCVMGFIYSAISILTLIMLIDLRRKNLISIGDFVMSVGLVFYLIETSWRLIHDIEKFAQDFGKLKESFSIFTLDQEIKNDGSKELIVKKPAIEFRNVFYSHQENKEVFSNLNLKIEAGQRIGLVGHSGAGKSTLINLLLKNFEVDRGDIIIDQNSIYKVSRDSLRSNIGLIPQDCNLFHRSIFDNIAYGKYDASMEEVVNASKKAMIHEFITSLPNGYDTLVGERGIKLSGGQRQRIAIARAILKNAPILILDEATSSLDSQTESEIQNSLNKILEEGKNTVIAIAHRLSTIKHMDRIVVLENGIVVEDGSFYELVNKQDGKFKELWDHQIGGMVI